MSSLVIVCIWITVLDIRESVDCATVLHVSYLILKAD